MAVAFCLFLLFTVVVTLPVKKTFDQRQDGGLNIHAKLDNVVIVLVPTSGVSLVDLAAKSWPNSLNLLGKTSQENFIPQSSGDHKSPTLSVLESKSGVESPVLVLKTTSSVVSLPGGSTELPLFSPATIVKTENKIATPGLLNKDFSSITINPSEGGVKASSSEDLDVSKSKHGENLSASDLKTHVSENTQLPSDINLSPETVSEQKVSANSPLSDSETKTDKQPVVQPLGDGTSFPQKQVTKESCTDHVEADQPFDTTQQKVKDNSGEPVSLIKEGISDKKSHLPLESTVTSGKTVPFQPNSNEEVSATENNSGNQKVVKAESPSVVLKKNTAPETNNK